MTFESCLHRLTVIASIPPGGRLGHTLDGRLFVASDGAVSAVWRLLLREGRERTHRSIREVLVSCDERLGDLSHSRFTEDRAAPEFQDLHRRVSLLCVALANARVGIEHLKITYASDLSAKANFDLLLQHYANTIAKAEGLRQMLQSPERY